MGDDRAPRLHFAPVPPLPLRTAIPSAAAERCLSLWIAGIQTLKALSDDVFAAEVRGNGSLKAFIRSYVLLDELARDSDDWVYTSTTDTAAAEIAIKQRYLKRGVRTLIHRASTLGCTAILLTPHSFVKLAALYTGDGARGLLNTIYTIDEALVKLYVREHVTHLTTIFAVGTGKGKGKGKAVDMPSPEHQAQLLQELSYLLMTLPETADMVMADHGFIEALAGTYTATPDTSLSITEELRRVVFTVVVAAIKAQRYSALIDFLFSVTEDVTGPMGLYIAAAVASMPLLDRLGAVDAAGFANRWATAIQRLKKTVETASPPPTTKLSRLRRQRVRVSTGAEVAPEIAGIAELKEMFPHIEDTTLHAVLASVNGDIESATLTLLDGISDTGPTAPHTVQEPPALDNLAVPSSRLLFGKRAASTADAMLSDRTAAPSKDRILAALQSFDSDDDERDDTYDADDIGGAVDRGDTADEVSAAATAANISDEDRVLYQALVATPGVFARDAVTRRGPERRKLRDATGMTDEAVEGWKLMLDRDGGKRLRQLEIRFSRESSTVEQTTVSRTAWRKGDDDDEEDNNGEGHRGGYHGRGRGRGRGGAGPNDRSVKGQQRDHAPVVRDGGPEARTVKKTTKSRGEHSRKMQSAARDRQRTKKMAKGM
ncbi:hypothetical protein ABW21_db0202961 [Orbilia brochopaga]|nr:hypothetical protein ABW21_db0202961 [Drechslerella brochopaga]